MAEIQNISIELVKVHPNNVRKTYNDIEELAESIKAKGILQNLTVVPDPQEPGKYLTVIGNRRLTAARMAGLETVPCIVSDMDEKEQTSVMLLENIQRSDLTVYEQAQGFQMMLDLGETEDTIAEKTGFSKKTVRHRLNIAKLDSKTLMEKERQDGYQLSLTDLYELEKIKDVKTRDKILKDSTDSRDLARRAINAQKEQKRQENMKLYVAMMKKLGLKKAPKEAERQNKRNKKQIKAILKEAANTRKAFIEGILSGRIKKVTNEEKVVAELFEQMMSWETFTGHNTLKEFFLGDKCCNAQKEDVEAAEKKMEGLSVLHKLLCMVSAMVADADLVDWNYTYSTGKGEKTKAFYKVLELYGFQYPNDEEKGVVEGTSDLYVKKEGAK